MPATTFTVPALPAPSSAATEPSAQVQSDITLLSQRIVYAAFRPQTQSEIQSCLRLEAAGIIRFDAFTSSYIYQAEQAA